MDCSVHKKKKSKIVKFLHRKIDTLKKKKKEMNRNRDRIHETFVKVSRRN